MNKQTIARLASVAILLAGLGVTSAFGQFNTTGTTPVTVTVAAEASIQIDTPTTGLTSSGTLFSDYTGTTNFTYKIRTAPSITTGSVTVKITDFTGSGGPSVAAPLTGSDTLAYTCSTSAPAIPCGGSVTSSTTTGTSVAAFPGDAHSAKAGNGGNSVSWTLTNDPLYKTGTYSATATFTIGTV